MQVASGTITITTGAVGTTFSATGLSFQPVAVFLCWSGRATAGQGEADQTFGAGFFTGTSARRVHTISADNANGGAYASQLAWANNACVGILDNTGGGFIGLADVDAILSDGFRLIVDDQFPANLIVGWLAIGGSEVSADIVDWTNRSGTGTQDITTAFALDTGLDDKLVIALGGVDKDAGITGAWGRFGIGVAAGNTIAQALSLHGTRQNANPSETWAYSRMGDLIQWSGAVGVDSITLLATLTTWLSTGFRLNYTENSPAAGTIRFTALVLKGGRYEVGNFTTVTDTDPHSEATTYMPLALLLSSVGRTESAADTPTPPAEISVGVATGASARWAAGVLEKDNVSTSDIGIAFLSDAMYLNQSTDATIVIEGQMDLDSFDSTPGFTWRMDDADPSASFVWYVVFAGGGGTRLAGRPFRLAGPVGLAAAA